MKPCLADVNVLLALVAQQHQHHRIVRQWYEGLSFAELGLCRIAQLGLTRLLCNPKIMGRDVLSAGAAFEVTLQLLEDERVDFLVEPEAIEGALVGLLRYSEPTTNLITDAYLAAFALQCSRCIVTLDRGFRELEGVEVLVLQ